MKKKPTLEQYKILGAKFRLLRHVMNEVLSDKALSKSETDELFKASKIIENLRCKKDSQLFENYPEISNDYLSTFYGSLDRKIKYDGTGGTIIHNPVDEEVICTAKDIAKSFFDESILKEKKK